MVDVFIRNVEEDVYREFKARAAREGVSMAEEFKHFIRYNHGEKKGGAAAWLANLKPIKITGRYAKNASENVDEIIGEAVMDDYNRYQRSRR